MIQFQSHGSLYHTLDQKTIDYLFRVGEVIEYKKKEVIFLESDEAYNFFLILEGRVKISRLHRDGKEVVIAILSSGNFFGDMALLDGFPRSTDAYSEGNSKILSIREDDFFALLKRTPKISVELLRELAYRIRNSDSQIKGLSLLNARGRVSSTLLRWALDQGEINKKVVVIKGIPAQKEMASYAGLSRESFNRILKDLEREKFIDTSKHRTITINNFPLFKKIFGPFF